MAAAALVAGGAVAVRIAGAGAVTEYPALEIPLGPGELMLAAVVLLGAALPFAGSVGATGGRSWLTSPWSCARAFGYRYPERDERGAA